jgi:GntR family transcriptional regulator
MAKKNLKLTLNHKSPVPLHRQAEELLRKLIQDPAFRGGKLLPNEVDLAQQLGISRTTLRQALNKLVHEGLLVRKKGVGTTVADAVISTRSANWLSFSQEMKARGIAIKNCELHVSWVQPDETIATFFKLLPGQKVLKLERLRGRPEYPFVYFISWFHPRSGLTGEEDFKRPLYDILEADYNVTVDLSKEEIAAKAADKFIAGKLEIEVGSPVLFRKRFVYDKSGQPVEYNLGYYRADSFVYTIESRRGS